MNNNEFISIDKKHKIKIILMNDVALFEIIEINNEFYKTLLYLLKDIMIYIKKNDIKYIQQTIMESDLELFKLSQSLKINDNEYLIITTIENFMNEIVDALGIKHL